MTDADGRKYRLICPYCEREVYACPDPACVGVGHHQGWPEGCDHDDVPLALCRRVYE